MVGPALAAAVSLAPATMVGLALALTVTPLPRPPPELKLAPTPLAAVQKVRKALVIPTLRLLIPLRLLPLHTLWEYFHSLPPW